ncbi:MAG: hypothetical protein R3B41_02545 [Candidatus Doudnabacteria bacterium]
MKVVVCGSMAFLEQMEQLKQELENLGFQVIIPKLTDMELAAGEYDPVHFGRNKDGKYDPTNKYWKDKAGSLDYYFGEIKKADIVLVANYDKKGVKGYIGGNVLMEMALAFWFKLPMYLLQTPDYESLSYSDEILGTGAISINHDLSLIQKE